METMEMGTSQIQQLLTYGVCRCCASKGYHKEITREYLDHGEREVYADIFAECFNIIFDTTSRSQLICSSCVQRLRDANNFREMVLVAEGRLLDPLLRTGCEFATGRSAPGFPRTSATMEQYAARDHPRMTGNGSHAFTPRPGLTGEPPGVNRDPLPYRDDAGQYRPRRDDDDRHGPPRREPSRSQPRAGALPPRPNLSRAEPSDMERDGLRDDPGQHRTYRPRYDSDKPDPSRAEHPNMERDRPLEDRSRAYRSPYNEVGQGPLMREPSDVQGDRPREIPSLHRPYRPHPHYNEERLLPPRDHEEERNMPREEGPLRPYHVVEDEARPGPPWGEPSRSDSRLETREWQPPRLDPSLGEFHPDMRADQPPQAGLPEAKRKRHRYRAKDRKKFPLEGEQGGLGASDEGAAYGREASPQRRPTRREEDIRAPAKRPRHDTSIGYQGRGKGGW